MVTKKKPIAKTKTEPKDIIVPSPELAILQKKVLTLQDGLGALLLSSAEKAWALGRALNELKEATPHGEWEAWCRENLRYSQPQIKKFMRIGTLEKLPLKGSPGILLEDDPLRLRDLDAIASIAKREDGDVEKATAQFLKNQAKDHAAPSASAKRKVMSEAAYDAAVKRSSQIPPSSKSIPPMPREAAFLILGIDIARLTITEESLDILVKGLRQRHHPDKGGDETVFIRISKAMEILK